jgi:adenosylcobinamide-GDP ribazoletransferase
VNDTPHFHLPPPLRGARAAFAFLSRIPVGGFPYRALDWRWAPAHFPLVGLVVGALSALMFWLMHPVGAGLAAVLSLALSILLTGAFHEDGLADSADALGGGHDRESILAILKDSRIGAYGALALGLSLALRLAAIGQLRPEASMLIVLVHCLARIGPVWLLATKPYVSSQSTSKGRVVAETGVTQALTASLYGLLTLAICSWAGWIGLLDAAVVCGALLAATLLLARFFQSRLGGVTGDLLGASEQLGELVAWVALAVSMATRTRWAL